LELYSEKKKKEKTTGDKLTSGQSVIIYLGVSEEFFKLVNQHWFDPSNLSIHQVTCGMREANPSTFIYNTFEHGHHAFKIKISGCQYFI